jgi:hypothetical protein
MGVISKFMFPTKPDPHDSVPAAQAEAESEPTVKLAAIAKFRECEGLSPSHFPLSFFLPEPPSNPLNPFSYTP